MTRPKIAIAFDSPLYPSETFVRQTLEELAPGRTIGLCLSNKPETVQENADAILKTRNMAASAPLLRRKIGGAWSIIRTGSRFSPSYSSQLAAEELLRKENCKVILAEYAPNGCAVRNLAERVGARLFVRCHGADLSSGAAFAPVRREYRRLFVSSQGVIIGSKFFGQRAIELGCRPDRLFIIPPGIDTSFFVPSSSKSSGKRIVAVGTLTAKKGPDLTVRAFAEVRKLHGDATLDIVGDGELRGKVETLICELKLSGAVRLHGDRPQEFVRDLLQKSDLFVQHSLTAPNGDIESFGISLVEAMACGLPVVVTRHNGFPETIAEGETGLLVEEQDVDGMANAITGLIEDPKLRASMGAAGRRRSVTMFDKRVTLSRLRNVLGLT